LTASIGHARFPDDGNDVDALLEAADRSMYKMKRNRSTRSRATAQTQEQLF
jgi:diguanylate cyclase